MKKHTLFYLFLSAFILTACDNEETLKSEISSINADDEFTGEIEDFTSGDIDSIKVCDISGLIIGASNVTTSGKFNIKLTTPDTNLSTLIREYLPYEFDGNISNEYATISQAFLLCYKEGELIGILGKCNYPVNQTSDNVGLLSSDSYHKSVIFGNVGSAYSDFIYCSNPVTIKGNGINEIYAPVTPEIYIDRMIFGYDILLQKGWNEVIIKYTSYSTTTTAYIFNLKVSNLITKDLKWRIFRQENL